MATLIALVLGFLFFEVVLFTTHRLMHERWTGALWRSHHLHHQLYHPRHPASTEFKPVGWRSLRYRALLFLVVNGLILWLFPWVVAIPLVIEMIVLSYVNDYLHDATHTVDHPLARFALFKRLQRLHWAHHANARKNFGILTFFLDRLNRSYQR